MQHQDATSYRFEDHPAPYLVVNEERQDFIVESRGSRKGRAARHRGNRFASSGESGRVIITGGFGNRYIHDRK
jgi:hypothetical protein